ncbi:MAG TPA: hypothetical protein VFV61_06590 [Pyrinomonadaceae bacterium]|nr:hypothetical protein [Pyrinomonadaceae bacterium]
MRLRDCLIAATLMSLTLITTLARPLPPRTECADGSLKPSAPARMVVPPAPALIAGDEVLEGVYYNTLAILSSSNRCSDFFGGPSASMEVFSQLMRQVRKDVLAPSIAMRMHGETINAEDARSNLRYRLFAKVSINTNGPFYRKTNFRSERTIFGVGSFAPNTREVRVLILLHELGHLMKGPDGNWLLPDDGGKEELSRDNSRKIEKVCGDQISALGNGEALRNLALRIQPEERLALDRNNSEPSPLDRTGNH